MKIEAGKWYQAYSGSKVGPIKFDQGIFSAPFPTSNPTVSWGVEYGEDGKTIQRSQSGLDLVAEWTEHP